MHILFVEDDQIIASGLEYALIQEGYTVRHCTDVKAAISAIEEEQFGFAILDLSLPDGTGFTVSEALRPLGVPTLFLTAADDEGSAVRALETGADDYVTKPFRLRELLARIRSILRRTGDGEHSGLLALPGNIVIDTHRAKVTRSGAEVELTALEYRLLLTLAGNAGRVLTRAQLLEGIWDVGGSFVSDNTLTVYIKRLREKLEENPQEPALIQTVRGMGYQLGK